MALEANVPLLNHNHSGTGTRATNQLSQANTHQSPDTDTASSSLHHTIGPGSNQAASGSHLHAGAYMPVENATGMRNWNGAAQTFACSGVDTPVYFPTPTRATAFVTGSNFGVGSAFTINRTGIWALSCGVRFAPLPGGGGQSYISISKTSGGFRVAEGGPQSTTIGTRSCTVTDFFINGESFLVNAYVLANTPGGTVNTEPDFGWTFFSLYWLHD
jgi:hypothetical protein